MRELLSQVDVVYHLAAVLGVENTVVNPLKVITGGIDGTRNVLELAFEKKVKVIFASTSEIYGKNEQLPFHELSNRLLGPPSIHRWCYATAKALDEHMCFAYADKGLPVTILRYFNAYGPGQTNSQYGMVIPRFIQAALRSSELEVYGFGKQSRCFTFIDDTITGTIAAMKPEVNGLVINIGSSQSITIEALAKKIISLSESTSKIIYKPYEEVYGSGYEDIPARIPDLNREKKYLDYEPKILLDEGLKQTIHWYRNQYATTTGLELG